MNSSVTHTLSFSFAQCSSKTTSTDALESYTHYILTSTTIQTGVCSARISLYDVAIATCEIPSTIADILSRDVVHRTVAVHAGIRGTRIERTRRKDAPIWSYTIADITRRAGAFHISRTYSFNSISNRTKFFFKHFSNYSPKTKDILTWIVSTLCQLMTSAIVNITYTFKQTCHSVTLIAWWTKTAHSRSLRKLY